MNLAEHLHIGSPLVWVRTDEPDRIISVVKDHAREDVFMLDPFKGFVKWTDRGWKKVIISKIDPETGEEIEVTATDPEMAISYVVEQQATMIVTHAHKGAEDLLAFYSGIYGEYRETFFQNDLDKKPAQFILISSSYEYPPEMAHIISFVDHTLPDANELASLIAHIGVEVGDDVKIDLPGAVKAGIGLSEPQFMQAAMLNLSEKGEIDFHYINQWKLDMIKQGGILEIRQPKLSLDDIGGLDLAKELITNAVWIWNNPEEAKEYHLDPINRILLVGVPGSGKSAICEATATSLNLDLAKTGISQSMNKFIGQSEENMRTAFAQIKAMAPLVVWMDELGRDLSSGDWEGDGGTTSRVHGEFLTGIQELPSNVFLMAAANRIDRVAPEMLRADRFDKIMFVGLPSVVERESIFAIHLGDQAESHDLNTLAEATDTYTGAEIKQLVKEVRNRIAGPERRHPTTQDFLDYAPNMRNRIWLKSPELIIEMYKRALTEWEWASSEQLADAQRIIGGQLQKGKVTKGNEQFSSF